MRIGRVNTQSRSSGKEGSRNGATSGRTVIIIGPGKKCTRCKCRSLGLTVVPWVHRSLLATPLAAGYAYIHVVNLERCYEPFLLLVFRRVFHFRVQENRASERFPRLVNWFAGPPGLSESEKEEETREKKRERNVKRITDRDTGKNSSQKSRRWIVRAVYFTRMMRFCVCGCLISRKSWNIVVGALRGIDQIVAPLLTAFLFCFSFSFLFSPFYPPFESYCKINICFRF